VPIASVACVLTCPTAFAIGLQCTLLHALSAHRTLMFLITTRNKERHDQKQRKEGPADCNSHVHDLGFAFSGAIHGPSRRADRPHARRKTRSKKVLSTRISCN